MDSPRANHRSIVKAGRRLASRYKV